MGYQHLVQLTQDLFSSKMVDKKVRSKETVTQTLYDKQNSTEGSLILRSEYDGHMLLIFGKEKVITRENKRHKAHENLEQH